MCLIMSSHLLRWRSPKISAAALRRLVQTESFRAGEEAPPAEQPPLVSRVVNVAIIGAPNSGKSTLINNIVGRKVCAASNKVHTTTSLARAMCVVHDTQIIFLDTPGVVTEKEQKKYSLPQSMWSACDKSLRAAEVVGVVHDVAGVTRDSLHRHVVQMLEQTEDTPSFLILNKVDVLKAKRQLLTLIRNLTNGIVAGKFMQGPEVKPAKDTGRLRGFSRFSDVFLVSALKGDGVADIRDYLVSNAKPANLHYSESEWTDQTPERLIEETVRAKFLDFLAQELPYRLTTTLEYYEDLEEKVVCSVVVTCPSERIARLISGSGGGRLQQIKSYARGDLVSLFQKPVSLDLHLKVKYKPNDS